MVSVRVYLLFLLRFCQASNWRHNSSSQAVAVGILAAKQTLLLVIFTSFLASLLLLSSSPGSKIILLQNYSILKIDTTDK